MTRHYRENKAVCHQHRSAPESHDGEL